MMGKKTSMVIFFWSFLVIQSFLDHPEGLPEPRNFSHIGRFATKEECEQACNDLIKYFGNQEVYRECHEHDLPPKDEWKVSLP